LIIDGDKWSVVHNGKAPNPEAQLTLMNARVAALVAGRADHGGLAGDQLYVDLDLSGGRPPAQSAWDQRETDRRRLRAARRHDHEGVSHETTRPLRRAALATAVRPVETLVVGLLPEAMCAAMPRREPSN
jgi:hypothetical protein